MAISLRFRSALFMTLGRILSKTGNANLAALCFREVGDLTQASSAAYEEARALWSSGDVAAAEVAIRQFLSAKQDHPEANNLLGAILLSDHKPTEASGYLRLAIAAKPAYAAAHNNLGSAHRETLDFAAAETEYRLALASNPDYVEALTNLGTLLNDRGRYVEAEPLCRKAVELAPGFAGAHCNLGSVLLNRARIGEAVAEYRQALKLDPRLVEAHINLALTLGEPSGLANAIEYYERILEREPDNFLARLRIGMGLQALGRYDEAERRFLEAKEVRPNAAEIPSLFGNSRLSQGDAISAIRCFREAIALGAGAGPVEGIAFSGLYLPDYSADQLCNEARLWASMSTAGLNRFTHSLGDFTQSGPLKVGYISRDFGCHSVAYFLEPLMRHHDARKMEIFCYCNLPTPDDWTPRFQQMAHTWRDVWMFPDQKVAEMVAADGIQILIDLSGHTSGNRLGVLARCPAPIQVTYLGHPGTTGLPTMDYRLSDAVADPEGMTETHYTEKIWRLPRIFLAYQPSADAPESAVPPCLTNGYVTFGSFNNALKISQETVKCWAQILKSTSGSRLILKAVAFSNEQGRTRISEMLMDEGIQSERFDLVAWFPDTVSHLDAYGKIDIALDTFPYNGTTTTCEALWMGVPVVCLVGDRHSARVGASLLTSLGMEELLANNREEYVAIAVQLAADFDRLRALRASMRDRMQNSPLLDPAGLARVIEQAFQTMWNTWRDAQTPQVSDAMPNRAPGLQLHLGGIEPKPGWTIVNALAGPNVDVIGDVRDLSGFDTESVAEIYASHVLEHVSQNEMPSTLAGLYRVLKRGGELKISVPDLEVLARHLLDPGLDRNARHHVMRMMFGGQTDEYDFHYIGLYYEFLHKLLSEAGFTRIEKVESFGLFNDTSDYAPYGVRISLNVRAVRG